VGLTEEKRLVRVAVDEAFDGRVGFLVEGVKGEFGMVRDHA
jgi:hypothetical protein